ncbi:Uncharacterised protein [Mycobacteroides abscessus subsp. abscessus]|nr:Uncharacterised protein [Mycobacteroides abscessus subsp. abscessus]
MPGFVTVDVTKHLVAYRVVDLVEQELDQRPVQGGLQRRNHRAQRRQRQAVAVTIEPFDDKPDVLVGHRHFAFFDHSPTAHESQFGVGVPLLLGMKVSVDLLEIFVGRLLGQCREPARTHVLDPHQVGHELLERGALLLGDLVSTWCVPVDVGQCPLLVLDGRKNAVECDCHRSSFLVSFRAGGRIVRRCRVPWYRCQGPGAWPAT